jgi:hypothetical protein
VKGRIPLTEHIASEIRDEIFAPFTNLAPGNADRIAWTVKDCQEPCGEPFQVVPPERKPDKLKSFAAWRRKGTDYDYAP